MKIVIAGGTGVIGRRAVRALAAAGHTVTVLSRSEANDAVIAGLGAAPARCDLFDRNQVNAAIAGQEVVVNLATRIPPANEAFKRKAWATNDRIRIEGSANLVNAAIGAGCRRFIQESIVLPYIDRRDAWIDESVAFASTTTTRCVLDAEGNANRFTQQGGTGVVLRFGSLYAPDASHTRAYLAMASKGMAPVMGLPSAYASSIHADDAASAVVAALAAPPGTYNITDDEPLSRADTSQIIASTVGRKRLYQGPRWLLTLLGGDTARLLMRSQRISNAKMRQSTGWKPQFPSMRTGWPIVAAAAKADLKSG
jgi:nucleoside-diphosphate-sugar epimerase